MVVLLDMGAPGGTAVVFAATYLQRDRSGHFREKRLLSLSQGVVKFYACINFLQ